MTIASRDPVHPRSREEVVRLFTGFELLPPGVADAARPLDPAAAQVYAGVGREPWSGSA